MRFLPGTPFPKYNLGTPFPKYNLGRSAEGKGAKIAATILASFAPTPEGATAPFPLPAATAEAGSGLLAGFRKVAVDL